VTGVAMTLNLTAEQTEALRVRAAREGASMQNVAQRAVDEYIERHNRLDALDSVLNVELPRYADALRRLGE
jgi:plasmid stability protein